MFPRRNGCFYVAVVDRYQLGRICNPTQFNIRICNPQNSEKTQTKRSW